MIIISGPLKRKTLLLRDTFFNAFNHVPLHVANIFLQGGGGSFAVATGASGGFEFRYLRVGESYALEALAASGEGRVRRSLVLDASNGNLGDLVLDMEPPGVVWTIPAAGEPEVADFSEVRIRFSAPAW